MSTYCGYLDDVQSQGGYSGGLLGSIGDDDFHGDRNDDNFSSGSDSDTFVVDVGDNCHTITDYNDEQDLIDLSGFGFASFQDAINQAQQVGDNAVFDFGGGDVPRLT